jgi:sulfide:quinone oxidoreductase
MGDRMVKEAASSTKTLDYSIYFTLFQVPGLLEGLKDNRSGVCSNYSPLYVTKTYGCIQRLDSGNAIFTYPNSPVKCAGAPQKIAYITADYMQRV